MDRHNWDASESPVAVSNLDKFEKKNEDFAVNVLFTNKSWIYMGCRSEKMVYVAKSANSSTYCY